MKLEKAIEILTLENKHPWNHGGSDLRAAVKLGIKALKREQVWRLNDPGGSIHLLPGETED